MHHVELKHFVDTELRQLPTPRAPHTLLPRVLAAVQEWRTRPWYAREWFTWPLGWQVVSAAALILLVAGGAMLLPAASGAAGAAASTLTAGVMHDVGGIAHRAEVAAKVAQVLWRALLEPLVPYAFVLVMLMSLACGAFAVALNHVAFGRTLQS